MSWSLTLGAIWALLATVTALLPMRLQYKPGLSLLLAAPVLIIFIGWQHGWIWCVLALAGFVSMFRNPLIYVFRRLRGQHPEIPK